MKFRRNTTTTRPDVEKGNRPSWRMLLDFVKEEPRTYLIGIGLAVVVGVLELAGVSALIPALAVSSGEALSGVPRIVGQYLPLISPIVAGVIVAVLILAQTAISYLREYYFVKRIAIWRTEYSIDYVRSIAYADWSGAGKLQPGEAEVMLTRNIALSMKLRHMTANFIADIILSLIYTVIVVLISWYTVFLFIAIGLVFSLMHTLTVKSRMRYAVLARDRYVEIARKVIEYFSDTRSLIISDRGRFLNVLRHFLNDAAFAQQRNDRINLFFKNVHQPVIVSFFIISAAAFYALGQSIATLVGIFYIFYRAAPHIVNAISGYGTIVGESPIDVIPEIARWHTFAPPQSGGTAPKDGSIFFDGVDVGYKDGVPLLKAVYLEVKPGQLVGMIGKSGTGKSTLLDIICGFQAPRRGSVVLGGVGSKQLDWSAWRQKLGLLRAESVVVSGTWVENVAFLTENPNLEKVSRLLDMVGLGSLVGTFTEGIHSHITARGENLSAGQRQRLLMARALYRDPKLLILDEPTSNLDVATEMAMYELLLQFKGKMTILVVSHQKQILKHADRVYEVATDGRMRVITEQTQ